MCLYSNRKVDLKNCKDYMQEKNSFAKKLINYKVFEKVKEHCDLKNMEYLDYCDHIEKVEKFLTANINLRMTENQLGFEFHRRELQYIMLCENEMLECVKNNKDYSRIDDRSEVSIVVMRYLISHSNEIKQELKEQDIADWRNLPGETIVKEIRKNFENQDQKVLEK